MQNQYVGDVGDFAKFGLLRCLSRDLRLGVVWYIAHDAHRNRDGRHLEFLQRLPDDDREEFRRCDPDLWERLRDLVMRDARCVHCLEDAAILPPGAAMFNVLLRYQPGGTKALMSLKHETRRLWLEGALRETGDADLVFLDPDNGIRNNKTYQQDGPKYAYPSDVEAFWNRGQSIVVYHHPAPVAEGTEERIRMAARLVRDVLPDDAPEPIKLKWSPWGVRGFLVFPHLEHCRPIRRQVNALLAGPWGQHFEELR